MKNKIEPTNLEIVIWIMMILVTFTMLTLISGIAWHFLTKYW